VWAAIEAKKRVAAAQVTLATEEACEPYEKPPLSKAVLLSKAQPEDTPIAGKGGLAAPAVDVRLNTRALAIDRTERAVETSRLPYDALVLATGSLMRELPLLPPVMARVHYLRSDVQARALRATSPPAGPSLAFIPEKPLRRALQWESCVRRRPLLLRGASRQRSLPPLAGALWGRDREGVLPARSVRSPPPQPSPNERASHDRDGGS
jgi:Pyridine nucleotide-disulphide oxidoreductase